MIENVPALASPCTAQVKTCDGASPGFHSLESERPLGLDLLDLLLEHLAFIAAGSGGPAGRLRGVHAHGVDGAVDADPAGQSPEGLDRDAPR